MISRSRVFFSTLLLLYFLVYAIVAQVSEYQTAATLVQEHHFDQAITLLQQILDRSSADLKARNLMGIALSATGRRKEANEQFRKVLAFEPKFIPALKNLAVNELAMGQAQDAKLHFEEALKFAPQDPTCHFGLAEISFAAHNFGAAVTHYEQSGELALRDPQVTVRFAHSYVEAKQPEKAATLLERVPWDTDSNTQFQVGLLLAKLEKFGPAARRFELAKQGATDLYPVNYNLMLVLVRERNYAAAIRTGEEMLRSGNRKAELYNLLARAYDNDGKIQKAYESLRVAIELEPLDEANYLDLITLCVKHQNYDLSLSVGEVGLKRIPKSHRLHLQVGVVLALKAQYEDAVREFRTAAKLAPEAGLAQVALGLVLTQTGKLTEAIDLLRRQSEKSPDNAEAFWFLADALNQSGPAPGSAAEKESIQALEKSLQLDPTLAQPRALLGKILLRRGEVDRAIGELERALELDPEDLTTTYLLAQALQKRGDTTRARQLFAKVGKARNQELESTQRNLLRIMKPGPH